MDFVLVPGLWLTGSAWAEVATSLEALGHRPVPLTLPGQGDGSSSATLDDQVAAVVAAVDGAVGPPVVVGHSAAATLAWMAADARSDKVAAVVLIGGWPSPDGEAYADFFEPVGGVVPFPGWEPFEGPDSADLDEATKQKFEASAVSVPETVTKATVRLRDDRRYDVPVTLICPEFSPADAREWITAGNLPELAAANHLDLVDIESGHWPMFTRPQELAKLLAAAAEPRG